MVMNRQPATGPARRGYVLFAVLIVVVVLSLVAYRYAESMSTELQVSVRASEAGESKGFASSGVHYAIGLLADPDMKGTLNGNPYDNKDLFGGIAVGDPAAIATRSGTASRTNARSST